MIDNEIDFSKIDFSKIFKTTTDSTYNISSNSIVKNLTVANQYVNISPPRQTGKTFKLVQEAIQYSIDNSVMVYIVSVCTPHIVSMITQHWPNLVQVGADVNLIDHSTMSIASLTGMNYGVIFIDHSIFDIFYSYDNITQQRILEIHNKGHAIRVANQSLGLAIDEYAFLNGTVETTKEPEPDVFDVLDTFRR